MEILDPKNYPIHPSIMRFEGPCTDPFTGAQVPEGTTNVRNIAGIGVRHHFASLAMQGLLAGGWSNPRHAAETAVACADYLLEELDRKP